MTKQKPVDPSEDWKEYRPGFEKNGEVPPKIRTKDYPKPEEKKPEPAVTEGNVYDWADYGCMRLSFERDARGLIVGFVLDRVV